MRFKRVDPEFATPFRIAYQTRAPAQTVQVELGHGGLVGRGEGDSVPYHGETVEKLLDQLQSVVTDFRNGVSRESLLPAGGARNALDCALWDLEAKSQGRRIWDMARICPARPLLTAYTLSVDTPEQMSIAAASAGQYSLRSCGGECG